ncbi:hypothetical protein C8J57DRAFT_1579020 [Mycena rebaudengoi]|nr:hypothetical protein C8J57DRAFT_1579020 [Mycena rebaudengoi]
MSARLRLLPVLVLPTALRMEQFPKSFCRRWPVASGASASAIPALRFGAPAGDTFLRSHFPTTSTSSRFSSVPMLLIVNFSVFRSVAPPILIIHLLIFPDASLTQYPPLTKNAQRVLSVWPFKSSLGPSIVTSQSQSQSHLIPVSHLILHIHFLRTEPPAASRSAFISEEWHGTHVPTYLVPMRRRRLVYAGDDAERTGVEMPIYLSTEDSTRCVILAVFLPPLFRPFSVPPSLFFITTRITTHICPRTTVRGGYFILLPVPRHPNEIPPVIRMTEILHCSAFTYSLSLSFLPRTFPGTLTLFPAQYRARRITRL